MKKNLLISLTILAVLFTTLFMSVQYGVAENGWTVKQPMPAPAKADGTAAVYNDKLYVFGGYCQGAGDARSETYMYDPTTNVWTVEANMPTARWGPIAITFNDKIYVFGGEANGQAVNVNQVYDPQTNTWSTKNNMPSGFSQGLMGVQYGQTIHLFYYGLHYEYNPTTDTYATKAPMPTPRDWATTAVVGSKIYVIGGCSSRGATNTNEVYNPSTDTWTTKTAMPVYRLGATRENPVINGIIYVTHGVGYMPLPNWGFQTTSYAYDPATDSWQKQASAVYPRDGVQCGVINNKLYVVGGRADDVGPYGVGYNEEYDSVSSGQITVASVTASSSDGYHVPSMAIDGIENPSNYWGTDATVPQGRVPQWLKLDLGASYTVTSVYTHFYDGGVRTYSYYVEASVDGSSWTIIVPSKTGSGAVTDTFVALEARYVRITVTANTANPAAHIEQIKVYGPSSPPPPPSELQIAVSSVTASSNDGCHVPSMAIDGIENPSNYWGTDATVPQGVVPQWLKLDLGSVYCINTVVTHFYDGSVRTYTYYIQVSNDSSSWTTIVPAKNGSGSVTDTFPRIGARFVRITITANTANPAAHIEQIRVYALVSRKISLFVPDQQSSEGARARYS